MITTHSSQPPGESLVNWAGNYRYSTDRLSAPASIEQLQELVRKCPRLKILGTRHCFNGIADSIHHLVSLSRMEPDLVLDAEAGTVTTGAGVRYGELCAFLHAHGYALHNLASLPQISVGGTCATATHGSGVKNRNLAAAVAALELVTANGDLLRLTRAEDGETFPGAVVHLGALGVVTRLTLEVEPGFQVRQDVYLNLPAAELEAHFDEIMASGYSVSLFTDWQGGRINQVWIKRRMTEETAFDAAPAFYGATPSTRNLHPIIELSAENCTQQLGVPGPWHERLPHFRMGYTPSSGQELQSEYFVPLRNALEAIHALVRLRDTIGPLLMISELRTVAEDTLWMSPCYRQSCLAIHFTWVQDWDSVRKVLPLIERELAPFYARPHWGKLFTMSPAELQSRYEKLPEFKQLAAEYDPDGKFRNEFLDRILQQA